MNCIWPHLSKASLLVIVSLNVAPPHLLPSGKSETGQSFYSFEDLELAVLSG